MPHFSKEILEASPETLAHLRDILHGRQTGGRDGRAAPAAPSTEGRFGTVGGRGGPTRKRSPTAQTRA